MSDTPWYQPVRVADDLSRDLVTGWVARPDDHHDLVPDGCVDVLWISNGTAWLCGPETTGWTFALPPGSEAVGVRFRPGRAGSVLGLDTADIRDGQIRLDDILGSGPQRLLVEEVGAADPGLARVRVLESFARTWIADGREPDPVADQVARLLARDGTTSVGTLVRATELSERQLHRRCLRAFGYGPATLRRILRLQRFLRICRHPAAPRNLAVLSALAGYADQQHLARDSRAIARTTPSALLAAGHS